MKINSKLLNDAVESLAALPGIGKRTALRLSIHLLQSDSTYRERLAKSVSDLSQVQFCTRCHNIADGSLCEVCADTRREQKTICLVETIQDVMAIEETGQYMGLFHVLGGIISPIEGIGPEDLTIAELLERVQQERPEEVIMAISPTIDGETTMFYISKLLSRHAHVKVSQIARGVAFGGELQYTDELTLARSIMTRTPYLVS
ncbi:MAG: recombination mediator RecR [Saprospiraceae bacterium]|nr:recombination mediator RecR [Saprospiraceae bacterium]